MACPAPQVDRVGVQAVQVHGTKLGEDGEHLRRGDRPEEGEGGREAALRAVGEYLAGALPPGMAGLDFEHGPAGRHVRESQRQIYLGQPAELAGKVVADPVLFDGFRRWAALPAGPEQVHGRSAAVAVEPGTDAVNRPAVRKLNRFSPEVHFGESAVQSSVRLLPGRRFSGHCRLRPTQKARPRHRHSASATAYRCHARSPGQVSRRQLVPSISPRAGGDWPGISMRRRCRGYGRRDGGHSG